MTHKKLYSIFLIITFIFIVQNSFGQKAEKHLLDDFRWQNRLLLVFTPSMENAIFKNADLLLEENTDDVIDRDLILFYIFENSQSVYGDSLLNIPTAKYLREKFYAANGNTTFILIGKDGGEKMRTINQFSIDRLFNRIDEMPMRRSEIEERTFSFDSIKFE